MLSEEIARRDLKKVVIGSEKLFQLETGTYLITFNSLAWLDDWKIGELISGVVLVSAYKGIVSLAESRTIDEFKLSLDCFHKVQPNCIRQLLSTNASRIWSSPKPKASMNHYGASQARGLHGLAIRLDALLPEPQESVSKRRKIVLDECLPSITPETSSRKRLLDIVDAPSETSANHGKRRCHRGSRSAVAKESHYLSAKNRHCNGSAKNMFTDQSFEIIFFNIQGLLSHVAELTALLRISRNQPALVCFNEFF